MSEELRSPETSQEPSQNSQLQQTPEEGSPEELHIADREVETVRSASKWKFTSFQWVVVGLFSVMILILIIFLIMYAYKNLGDDTVADDTTQLITDAEEHTVDTSAVPPKIDQEDDALSEAQNTDDQEETETTEVKKPDLYIKSYDLGSEVTVGEEVTATITIGNKGTATAQNFRWEWWANDDERECKEDIATLNAGATRSVECTYTYDDTDEYVTRAVVDAKSIVDELNEENNIVTQEIDVIKKADLYVSNYEFNHDPVMGEEFTMRITIKNGGETDAGEFVWEWWSTVTGSVACREEISGLDAGESKQVECDHTYAGWSNYTTKAVVDADNDVSESDEGNNTYTQNVTPIH